MKNTFSLCTFGILSLDIIALSEIKSISFQSFCNMFHKKRPWLDWVNMLYTTTQEAFLLQLTKDILVTVKIQRNLKIVTKEVLPQILLGCIEKQVNKEIAQWSFSYNQCWTKYFLKDKLYKLLLLVIFFFSLSVQWSFLTKQEINYRI